MRDVSKHVQSCSNVIFKDEAVLAVAQPGLSDELRHFLQQGEQQEVFLQRYAALETHLANIRRKIVLAGHAEVTHFVNLVLNAKIHMLDKSTFNIKDIHGRFATFAEVLDNKGETDFCTFANRFLGKHV